MTWRDRIVTVPLEPGRWLTGSCRGGGNAIELTSRRLVGDDRHAAADRREVVWSGGCGPLPFEPHPDTWMPRGWAALTAACCKAPQGTLVRPHHSHVISDGLACRRFLEQPESAQLGLAFSPASMLTASMLPDHQDHVTRLFEMVANAASAIILEDLGQGIPCSAGSGCLDGPVLSNLLDEHAPRGVPIIVAAESSGQALSWLQ